MGSSASKASRTASTATSRKYPTRLPTQSATSHIPRRGSPSARPPLERSPAAPSHTIPPRNAADAIDAHPDAAFNARLARLGPVQPSPTFSNSSTVVSPGNPSASFAPSTDSFPQTQSPSAELAQSVFPSAATNPAVSLLAARERLMREAEEEFDNLGRRGGEGRRFVDVVTLRTLLMMRDELGKDDRDIERNLGLARGVVRKLGSREVISVGGA